MSGPGFEFPGVADPRLAVHAVSALPAWLWSTDGAQVLWANPVGANLLGAQHATAITARRFGPADQQRRQIAHLTGRLPLNGAPRLERLRGFGAPLGRFVTCACTRLRLADGSYAVLIAATEPVGRTMPLTEQLRRLIEGMDVAVAAYARDGVLVACSDAARPLLQFRDLGEAGLDAARNDALNNGRAEIAVDGGTVVLHRVGSGADIGLVALLSPGARLGRIAPPQPANHLPESAPRANAPEEAAEPAAAAAADMDAPADHEPAPEPASETDQVPVHGDAEPSRVERDAASIADAGSAAVIADFETELPSSREQSRETESDAEAEAEPTPLESHNDVVAADVVLRDHASPARRNPLRFVWQMDAHGHFSLGSDEFSRLIGAKTAAALGRLWSEIADALQLDPEGLVADAVASRNTWSGVTLRWPVDGSGARLPVELSGLPVFDRGGSFTGYRGFGVCRDLDALTMVASQRCREPPDAPPAPRPLAADVARVQVEASESEQVTATEPIVQTEQACAREQVMTVPTPQNVVPFPSPIDSKSPALTPVESNAFDELARQLSARLEGGSDGATPVAPEAPEAAASAAATTTERHADVPEWLTSPHAPAQGAFARDKTLLDLLPVGVLIYRLDRLIYANPAFLLRAGYDTLHTLAEAGGLDALLVEPGVSCSSSASQAGTPVTLTAAQPSATHAHPTRSDARLFAIDWDGEAAHALIFSTAHAEPAPAPMAAATDERALPAAGHAHAEDLGAILDTTAEGVVMFDAAGRIHACNRSAEALFGVDGHDMITRNLAELFAPESQRGVADYFDGVRESGAASLLDHGRELLGRVRDGGLIPLAITIGRTRPNGPNFFAVFSDLSQTRKSETDLLRARRQADRSASAKADVLARISHEVRTPLNAIIGFADVMIEQRFGALGNERYVEYMKDIRASGERVIAMISDLLDLSRIETGALDLAFADQNLNDLVESCVAVMQPQANRERIIIRTSLAHALPPVLADAQALRQIALNLIGNSIHLANAGGQVIVSTALSDFGDVMLRVRDTGHGLNDNEVAAAMEPFRTAPPSDQAGDSGGVSLSLTKALVEANRAQFQIRATPNGTLIEVVFGRTMAGA